MRKLTLALITLAFLLNLGCTSQNTSTTDTSLDTNISTANANEHYPLEISSINYLGEPITLTFDKAPEKVLAVYQGPIETMIALGLEDHVIASYGLDNDIKDEWQEGFSQMNYDETVFAPNLETVVSLQPDFIFSWGSLFSDKNLGDIDTWQNRGANAYISGNTNKAFSPYSLENEYKTILDIGKIFDVEDKAETIVNEMKTEILNTINKTSNKAPQRVLAIEYTSDAISNYGSTTLLGDMIETLGGEMIFSEGSTLSKEDIIASNPSVIFTVYMPKDRDTDIDEDGSIWVNQILNDEAFQNIDAVKNKRVYAIMLGDVYASAVRTIDGIKAVSSGLYPELSVYE